MQPSDLNLAVTITGYQRFLFLKLPQRGDTSGLPKKIEHLGQTMENMYAVSGAPSEEAFRRGRYQFLRSEPLLSSERDLRHPAVSDSDAMVRLEAATADPVLAYEAGLRSILQPLGGSVETLSGVQRPRSYTSHAMTQYAYASALAPQTGQDSPMAVVTPMNKTASWWSMDWMHRESFFLPRYDSDETLVAKGHAHAADAGIPAITRRLVHAADGYGTEGSYDFVGYFEFAEDAAPVFRRVMAALRDVSQNPEWTYVEEGPEWWGRRVGTAQELWVQ